MGPICGGSESRQDTEPQTDHIPLLRIPSQGKLFFFFFLMKIFKPILEALLESQTVQYNKISGQRKDGGGPLGEFGFRPDLPKV